MKRPEVILSKLLSRKVKTLAVAESCTGGLLANLLTNIPGSSRYFLLGVVAYSNQAKISLLNVPNQIIKRYGAVSAEVAQLMAQNVMRIACSDYGISITGIAGPLGGTPTKPTGTVFISVAWKKRTITKKFRFPGNRLTVKRKTVLEAISILQNLILKNC